MKVPVYTTLSEPPKIFWVPEKAVMVNALGAVVTFTLFGYYLEANILVGALLPALTLFGGHFVMMKIAATEPNMVGQFLASTFHRRPRPTLNRTPDWVDYVP